MTGSSLKAKQVYNGCIVVISAKKNMVWNPHKARYHEASASFLDSRSVFNIVGESLHFSLQLINFFGGSGTGILILGVIVLVVGYIR